MVEERWQLGRRPGLDGLRGIAVLIVVASHFSQQRFGGGYGVQMFFVLSGFLITSLLLEEWQRSGGIDLAGFYRRRARRLLPALAVVMAVFTLLDIAGLPLNLHVSGLLSIVFYVSNWRILAQGHYGALGHTWSLAVEEQFYIVWPVLLILAIRVGRRAGVLIVATVLAVASLVWSLVSGRSPMATDVTAWILLVGCVLACLLHGSRARHVPWWLSLGVVWIVVSAVTQADPTYRGHMIPPYRANVALLTALAIWAAVEGTVPWLETRWLRWVGVRSYGLYLWHFPIAYLLIGTGLRGALFVVVAVLGIGASFVLCALSWRYVEAPFLARRREPDALPLRPLPSRVPAAEVEWAYSERTG